MATNDFIHDMVQRLQEDNLEYVVITLQKGKSNHRGNAWYNIHTGDGADMLLATANEIFSADGVDDILSDEPYPGTLEHHGFINGSELEGHELDDDDDDQDESDLEQDNQSE
tara:strand:+ start:661 stop:996 length:336 start_codon:yes stop_codon:yes gene_type:complete